MIPASWSEKRATAALALFLLALVLLFMGRDLFPPSNQALGGHDTRGLFVPWLTTVRDSLRQGRLPFWDDNQFAGYPFLSNPQVAFFYPPTWITLILPINMAISWQVTFHIWLAAVGMLLFVRLMGASWLGALLAAITFAFGGFMAARMWAGHIGLIATNAWIPWLLLATLWAVRRGSGWSAVIAGLPLSLAFLAGHTASLLYIGLIWLTFALYLALTTRQWWLVGRQVLIAGLVGLALSSIQLLPFLELSGRSGRAAEASFDFATAYSLPPAQLWTLLVPDFFGEPVRVGYWGALTFEELTFYSGLLPLLALLIILRKPTRPAWLYIALILLGLLLALGSYGFLYQIFYDWLPPFRLARAPARASILFVFAASALLGEAISAWERRSNQGRQAVLRPWFLGGLALLAFGGLAAVWLLNSHLPGLEGTDAGNRLLYQIRGATTAVILLLIAGGLLGFYLLADSGSKRARQAVWILLIAFVLVDLWRFGYNLKQLNRASPVPMWADARDIIQADGAQSRVLPWGVSIFDQNGAGQVGLWSVFGYNALEPEAPIALAASEPDPRSQAYDVLSVGYLLANSPQDQYLDGERPLTLVNHTDQVWVYRRQRILPIARLVAGADVIADPDAALARLRDPDFDPRSTAILDQAPPCDLPTSGGDAGSLQVRAHEPGYWQLATSAQSASLLVLSQTAYPGWQVTVDGQAAEPLLAYTALQAVCVPAGDHTITWRYRPVIFIAGGALTLATLALVGAAIVVTWKSSSAQAAPD